MMEGVDVLLLWFCRLLCAVPRCSKRKRSRSSPTVSFGGKQLLLYIFIPQLTEQRSHTQSTAPAATITKNFPS